MARALHHVCLAAPMALLGCVARKYNTEGSATTNEVPTLSFTCEVLVAGGTTAALSAALFAKKEGKDVCLLEPTNWPGGQLSAEGVSAVDFSNQEGVKAYAALPENNEPTFLGWMNWLGNQGGCWVSKYCFEPRTFLKTQLHENSIWKTLVPGDRLFTSTVVKNVKMSGKNIVEITAISRDPKMGEGYDRFLSDDLPDWYSPEESVNFRKKILTFTPPPGKRWIVIDASPFGDVLVLSGAQFLQGAEAVDGGTTYEPGGDTCGQATVFPLVMEYSLEQTGEGRNPHPVPNPTFYALPNPKPNETPDTPWHKVWTYRRLRGDGYGSPYRAMPGDLSLQNWNPGNDYAFGYIFKSIADTKAEVADWRGGINIAELRKAEQHALGWHYWLKERSPEPHMKRYLKLNRGILGTQHGLSKLPYLRDTRRSIGLGGGTEGFLLNRKDLGYTGGGAPEQPGRQFADRIAIGAYLADIHPLKSCRLPGYFFGTNFDNTAPFYIPFRSLTNKDVDNLLVAGRTIAQSFAASTATRVHPVEWHIGVAAGVTAAHMQTWQLGTGTVWNNGNLSTVSDIQAKLRNHKQPLEWYRNPRAF